MSDGFLKINKGLSLKGQVVEPAGSNGDVYFNETLGKFRKFENGAWSNLAGSGSGTKNYISNGDAEANADGWSGYSDAAGTRPVDGTGGSPNVTFVRSISSPLAGQASFLFTKDTANRQGQGFSYNFTIDSTDKAKVLDIEMDYQVSSGTFVAGSSSQDSDLIVYIYDVTNNRLIEPSSFKFLSNSTSISDKFRASFQTSPDSVSYRLILHVASTSAVAYSLKFDDVKVGPSNYVYGTPVTDWQSFTPTGSWTTNSTYTGRWRRVGDTMEVQSLVTLSGAPNATNLTFNIPAGYSIDSSKIVSIDPDAQTLGSGQINDASISGYTSTLVGYQNSTSVRSYVSRSDATYSQTNLVTQAVPFSFGSGDSVQVRYSVPIVGWSSSVQMSDSTDTRVIAARAFRSTNQTGINPNGSSVKIQLNGVNADTHLAFNTSLNRYIIPSSGWYRITANILLSPTNVLANNYHADLHVNGVQVSIGESVRATAGAELSLNISDLRYLNGGDYLEIFLFGIGNNSVSTLTVIGGGNFTYMTVSKENGPQAIAASEMISLVRNDDSGQSFTANVTKDLTWNQASVDSHNSYNTGTGVYTIPTSGMYFIHANFRLQNPTLTTSQGFELSITDSSNAAIYAKSATYGNGNNVPYNISVTYFGRFIAGQTIKIRGVVAVAASGTTATSDNRFLIAKVGI